MTRRFEIRRLVTWAPRAITPDDQRRSARLFRAGWFDTIDLLQREVDLLDGGTIVLEVDADPSDIRRDGMLRAQARVGFIGVRVWFVSRHGPLEYATDAYDHWQANVRAIALGLGALRAVDRYGVTGSGEQYRGWTQITAAPAGAGLTTDEARRVLADAAGESAADLNSEERIVRAYRVAARVAHPDHGGNPDVFRLITTARDVLLAGRPR